jgi:hypothetical protein
MDASLLIVLAVTTLSTSALQQPRPQQQPDTLLSFATPATRALVLRGIARHRAQDSAVVDYQARIRYRLTASLGRRRWGRFPIGTVEEQDATVAWHLPNDLRVDVVGRRTKSRSGVPPLSSVFDRPWFVPRSVGDSVRIFSNEFPATGALHPLAADGPEWYHYDLTDSLSATAGGRRIRLYAVQFTPKRPGPALVVGRLWLDASSAEVVRFTFRYVGSELWARPGDEEAHDSASARRINRLVNSIVSIDADLEYGLEDGRYWMPRRQAIAGQVRVPLSDIVVPFQAVTTFDDYAINTGRPVAFSLPPSDTTTSDSARAARRAARDSLRAARERAGGDSADARGWTRGGLWAGGRYELHRPSNDSLARYTGWTDSLTFEAEAADERRIRGVQSDLALLVEQLPDEITLRKPRGFAYQNVSDALQYNRVQGLSLGVGYRERVPHTDFTDLFATVRYGFSDERVMGRLSLVRDAPKGRFVAGAWRDLADADPFSAGRTLANTASALFTGHDYGDYYLATGGGLSFQASVATVMDQTVSVRGERHSSVELRAHSAVNDFLGGTGDFPENPPIAEGDYAVLGMRLEGFGPLRWWVSGEGIGGEGIVSGRAMGQVQHGFGGVRGATIRLRAGYAQRDMPQLLFRLGGVNTVRGFEYGALRGRAFWAAQLDVSPLKGNVRPVLFIDAGQTARPGDLFSSRALVGGGIGLSLYSPLLRSTLFRLDLSHSISPDAGAKWRFDIVMQPVR